MQLQDLRSPKGSRKRKRIVGRGQGSGRGGTCGRGEKGQMSRSTGRATVRGYEGGQIRLIRRLPKMGFRSHRPILNQVVSLDHLNKLEDGTIVNAESLKAKGLIKSLNHPFKILGDGDIKKSLIIQEGAVSKTAQAKIVKAGGEIKLIDKNSGSQKKTKET